MKGSKWGSREVRNRVSRNGMYQRSMCLGWSPRIKAALHVNNACGHTFADAVRGAPPETHSSEGGGVWAEHLPKAALMSNDLFLMTSMCFHRSGWGAVATAQPSPLDRGRKII